MEPLVEEDELHPFGGAADGDEMLPRMMSGEQTRTVPRNRQLPIDLPPGRTFMNHHTNDGGDDDDDIMPPPTTLRAGPGGFREQNIRVTKSQSGPPMPNDDLVDGELHMPGAYAVPGLSRPTWPRRMSAHLAASFRSFTSRHNSPSVRGSGSRSRGAGLLGRSRSRLSVATGNSSVRRTAMPRIASGGGGEDQDEGRGMEQYNGTSAAPAPSENNEWEGAGESNRSAPSASANRDVQDADVNATPTINEIEAEKFEGDVRKGIAMLLCIGCLLVVIAVSVTVVLTTSGKNEEGSSNPSPAPTTADVISITEREDFLKAELAPLSKRVGANIFETDTPQRDALRWLANEDWPYNGDFNIDRLKVRYALATLYFSTAGGFWTDDCEFLTQQHECNWTASNLIIEEGHSRSQGVICDNDLQVIGLYFVNNNLKGPVPEEIVALTPTLDQLYVVNHTVADTTLGSIGSLDSLSELTNMKIMHLYGNGISRTFPTSFSQLTLLEELLLHDNGFSETIPSSYGSLTQLRKFRIDNNELTGRFLSIVRKFRQLEEFVADDNYNKNRDQGLEIPANDPSNFFDQTSLTKLSLRDVEYESVLNENLRTMTNLEYLNVGSMGLGPPTPTWLGTDLPKLTHLDMSGSNTLWTFPFESFPHDNKLEYLDLDLTDLVGQLPHGFDRFVHLKFLSLAFNKDLTGELPSNIIEMTNLESLSLEDTGLMGTLPSTIGVMTSLKELNLGDTLLGGTFPQSMQNLTSLEVANFYRSNITGNLEFFCSSTRTTNIPEITINCELQIECTCCICKE